MITTHAIWLQSFRPLNYLYVVFLENEGAVVPECEKEGLSDVPTEKCNNTEVPAETSGVNGLYDLADIITDRRAVSSISCIEKYGYLTKHYCPLDQESLFKKKVVKNRETKTLSYQLSWIRSKWWHACSKELQDGLCKACILFDNFTANVPRGNFGKNAFQNVSQSEKISEHKTKDYHNKALEKVRNFVMTFEDKTKAVTHGKHENNK